MAKANSSKVLATITVAVVAACLLVLARPALATITPTSTASDIANAVTSNPTFVTGASFASVTGGTPNAVSDSALTSFPTNGADYGILTTGDANFADDPNTSGSTGANNLGGSVRGNTDRDVSILKVDLDVPSGANCLSVDFQFLSDEHPEYVGSAYNDAFIAELDNSTWTTSGSTISAPDNFAFDPTNNVISINSSGIANMTAANATGTTYDGATQLLAAKTPVTPGPHSLYLSIFDQGDNVFDSAVFLDNLDLYSSSTADCQKGVQLPDNQPPTVQSEATDALGTEGDTLQTSGSFSDPDGDALTLSVPSGTPGTFTDNGDGTWSWELSTTDDVAQSTIEVTADDGNGGTTTDSFDYGAENADPELSGMNLTNNAGTACATNSVGLDFSFSDPGSADTHSGTINWGDSSQPTAFTGSPVDESHDYAPGTYTITVNVSDDDGGSDSDTGSVSRQYKVSTLLSPVNADGSSVSKYGSTIPLKVRITDCNNNPVSGLTPKISFTKVNPATPVVGINEGTSTQPHDTDFVMRQSDDFYIYNLATKSLADGNATYAAIIQDSATPKAFGPTQTQNFGLRIK